MFDPLSEEKIAETQVAALINEALDEIDAGAEAVDGHEFFSFMREKYGE